MSCGTSSKRTKSSIRAGFVAAALIACSAAASAPFEDIIREAAKTNGFVPAEKTHVQVNRALLSPGEKLFKSKSLSLNGSIACQTCHLDKFGSADGLPNAVAVGGKGEGRERGLSGGGILPRNTLPFWGRGGAGFNVFFWDGKINFAGEEKLSKFDDARPSDDSFITAVHLPAVEIREMLAEDNKVRANKIESVPAARNIFSAIADQLREKEPAAISAIAQAFAIKKEDVTFLHVATSLASFIREHFRLRETTFHRFVFAGGTLSDDELRGAQLFYGKGKCAACHSGAYFTDFQFHVVPLPQIGFGKNGFGVDYGRFNVTHNPRDLYKFRTPPLFNVERTAPYGHSGSVPTMREAITYHFDPLRGLDPARMKPLDRHEFSKRLGAASENMLLIGFLDDSEVDALAAFLKTLSFDIEKSQ